MNSYIKLVGTLIAINVTTQAGGAENIQSIDPAQLYHDYCSVCHGERGDGISRASKSLFPAPRDFTTDSARQELSRDRMIFSVKYGRPNTAMASWERQLNDTQIAAVVDYVRDTFMKAGATESTSVTEQQMQQSEQGHQHDAAEHQHATPTGDLTAYFQQPYPRGMKGNRDNGEALYKQNCVACHGEQGDGQGPRAYFILPKPRDFRHPAAKASLNRPHLFEAVAKGEVGSEMPAWEKVLNEQQIADISEYVLVELIKPEQLNKEVSAESPSQEHHHTNDAPHQH